LDLEVLRARIRPEVDASLRAAVAALDPRSRALFRYNLIDGWNVERIGAVYGVHRATIARWIAAARDELVTLVEKELAARLAISTDEVGSIIRLVRSRIDVSLARLLDDEPRQE
jgi:RNA polymerase sigma-70 factor, ECF subfamily